MDVIVGEVLKRLRLEVQDGEREACLLVDFPVEVPRPPSDTKS